MSDAENTGNTGSTGTVGTTPRARVAALMDDLRIGLPALNDEAVAVDSRVRALLEKIEGDRAAYVSAANERLAALMREVEATRADIARADKMASERQAKVEAEAASQRDALNRLRRASIEAFEALKG